MVLSREILVGSTLAEPDGSAPAATCSGGVRRMKVERVLAAALIGLTVACSGSTSNETAATPPPAAPPAAAPASASPPASPPDDPKEALPPEPESLLPEELRRIVDQTFTGDFDQMVSRRLI